jgi:hypothetical protein
MTNHDLIQKALEHNGSNKLPFLIAICVSHLELQDITPEYEQQAREHLLQFIKQPLQMELL